MPTSGMTEMDDFEFTLAIAGPIDEESILDRLFEAGCSDATFGSVDGAGFAEFTREATSFEEAVMLGIQQVESVPGLRVLRVEPDDLVTMSEIAGRLGRTRESIRLLVSGDRGHGGFPPPVSHVRDRFRLWRWSDVAEWAGQVSLEERQRAKFVAALNAALELRRSRDLPKEQRAAVRRVAAG